MDKFEEQLAEVLVNTRHELGREPEAAELAERLAVARPDTWNRWVADVVARRFECVAGRVARRLSRRNLEQRKAA